MLHHDNAPAHNALKMKGFWPNTRMEHPPYSLDLAPCDFYILSKVKTLKGTRHESLNETKQKRQTYCLKMTFSTVSRNGNLELREGTGAFRRIFCYFIIKNV